MLVLRNTSLMLKETAKLIGMEAVKGLGNELV